MNNKDLFDLIWLKKSKFRIKLTGGAYVAGMYSHARCELPYVTHVSVVVFVWRLSCAK